MSDWNDKLNGIRMTPGMNLDLVKARLKKEEPRRAPRAFVVDPLDTRNMMGFKDNPNSVTFDMLKAIPGRLGIIAAIIQTRCTQVASFSVPFRSSKSIGYKISPKHRSKEDIDLSKGEQEKILDLERFIYNCGHAAPNSFSDIPRDDFDTFLRKIVRDTLTIDQVAVEVVPDRRGMPYEFLAVDASTIRIASDQHYTKDSNIVMSPMNVQGHKAYTTLSNDAPIEKRPAFIQLVDGTIANVFSRDELAFGVRNPRTDLRVNGYGYSELEMMISTITSQLNAEKHNSVFFQNGTAPKGILNFKGDAMTPDQMEGFRRMWKEQMEGVSNFWRTPILQTEEPLNWVNLQTNNRDMEFQQWLEYLLKIATAIYLIDPAELNFDMGGGGQQPALFESDSEWKLKASRDKGLRPLLRFIATYINRHIVSKIDDNFVFEFVGLDDLSEKEKHDMRKEQVASYMTLNEIRRLDDRPALPYGDVPMNPTYVQAMQAQEQLKQQAAMAQQGQQAPGGAAGAPAQGAPQGGGAQQPPAPTEQEDDHDDHVPQYSDNFGKSLGPNKILEIDLDSFLFEEE